MFHRESRQVLMTSNSEAIQAWNTVLFDKFVRYRATVVTGLGALGDRALARLAPRTGERIVDLGCGFGDTTYELAHRVGASGRAVGLDASERFIAAAREDHRARPNASFHVADLEHEVPGGPYDAAFSRFGTMFFASPVIALRRIRNAVTGRLCMVVWRSKAANEWCIAPEQIVRELLGDPPKGDQVTCGPGPFSMASPDLVGDQLTAAGFTEIAFERVDVTLRLGRTIDEAVDFALALGPAGEVMRLAGDAGVARRAEIERALHAALAPSLTEDGVCKGAAAWIVTAR
jgi:SAM-dependent methyltransferase